MGVLYACEKLFVQKLLASYSETHISDPHGKFSQSNGLNVAFAMTSVSSDMSKRTESPETVTLKAELRGWSTPKNSKVYVYKNIELKTHPCTEEELGLNP